LRIVSAVGVWFLVSRIVTGCAQKPPVPDTA
jgi:hypothetical protein